MVKMDTELAKQAIVNADTRKSTIAKLKTGEDVNLYYIKYKDNEYIIVENDLGEDSIFYIALEEEIGETIFPNTELLKAMEGIKKALTDVIKLLEEDK